MLFINSMYSFTSTSKFVFQRNIVINSFSTGHGNIKQFKAYFKRKVNFRCAAAYIFMRATGVRSRRNKPNKL